MITIYELLPCWIVIRKLKILLLGVHTGENVATLFNQNGSQSVSDGGVGGGWVGIGWGGGAESLKPKPWLG